jgi:hypothetical protein
MRPDSRQHQGIIHLVEADFRFVEYSANDGVWEIVEEPKTPFLAAISQHDTLDSFSVRTITGLNDERRIKLDIVFDEREAAPRDEQIKISKRVFPPTSL